MERSRLAPDDDDDLEAFLEDLRSADPEQRAAALKVVIASPTGDARVRAAAEELLHDRSACIVQIPVRYGEVRWLAAQAVAAERRAAGTPSKVRLTGVVRPLDLPSLAALARQEFGESPPTRSPTERFDALLAAGQLPTYDLELG